MPPSCGCLQTGTHLRCCPSHAVGAGGYAFQGFISDMSDRLSEKKIDKKKVNIKDVIRFHLKIPYKEEQIPAIEKACHSILYLHYPVEVDFGHIIFPANARKSKPMIIEDILRAAGHPMTMYELYDAFTDRYPERSAVYDSFRGNINCNSNIVPIGRSSTYALAAWQECENRGGTIRSFVEEYLDSLEPPISSVPSIGDYVRRFRPETKDSSIVANLLQERTHKFALYENDQRRFIGYRSATYHPSFRLLTFGRRSRRTAEESLSLLTSFVREHHRFPLQQENDPEETKLYRFVCSMRSLYNRGKLNESDQEQWEIFMEKYGSCRMNRKQAGEVNILDRRLQEHLDTLAYPAQFPSCQEILEKLVDYYVQNYPEDDKEAMICPVLGCEMVHDQPAGKYLLHCILENYADFTKRRNERDGHEWISDDILAFFKCDDGCIQKLQDADQANPEERSGQTKTSQD